MSPLSAVSLFSNCGVGDLGFKQAGFRFDVMAELDWRRLEVAQLNHPESTCIPGDLRVTWKQVVKTYKSLHDSPPALLAACPPCQGMSSARSGRGRESDADAGSRDPRNLLVTVIVNVARALKPRIIVVENVPAFLTRSVRDPKTAKPISAALLLINSLARSYRVYPVLADLADYGVPQFRKRAFLTLVRKGEQGVDWLRESGLVPFPSPTHAAEYGAEPPVSLRQALKYLDARPLDAKDPDSARDVSDPMHFVPVWTDHRYPMVAAIPPDSGRSAWENDICPSCVADVADRDRATCHQCGTRLLRPTVLREGEWSLVKGFRNSSYRRMRSDTPSATITTASGHIGSDLTIHPWENRLLSPRECAHLQTIPHDFNWGDALRRWGATNVRDMIGEAVPPRFTYLHGLALAGLVGRQSEVEYLPAVDKRVAMARQKLEQAKLQVASATESQ
ncbi:DNA cytosine methyltransferase [Spongiactinospora sp. 9N601]|uniref:DNA cytosine methyltransferase n=1 Tax=Spongiactinospora sp. 9N601 TaxID=3375149 RepID=UPI0037A8C69E